MFSHPGLFVHLVPEVAEGPADFRHTLSLSVAPKRARLLLWYTGTHTQTDIFYPQTAAITRLTCSHILKMVIYSTIKVPWRTIWLLTRTTQFLYRTVKVPAAVKNLKNYFMVMCSGGLTCMLLTQRCWKTTSCLERSEREVRDKTNIQKLVKTWQEFFFILSICYLKRKFSFLPLSKAVNNSAQWLTTLTTRSCCCTWTYSKRMTSLT